MTKKSRKRLGNAFEAKAALKDIMGCSEIGLNQIIVQGDVPGR